MCYTLLSLCFMKNFLFSVLQILLLLYLLLSGPVFIFTIPFVLTLVLSLLFIFWALLAKRLHKSRVPSRLPRGIYLVTTGPYEIVRHPIYSGLLLFILNYVPGYFSLLQYLAFLFFAALMLLRIRSDEQRTGAYFKDKYREYKKRTKRLIPYIY